MSLNTTSFFNSNEVHISSRMNEYMKKNFGYEVEGDIDTLKEAKKSLEAEQIELKKHSYMNAKYMENMLMIETISSLVKAHGNTSIVKEDDKEVEYGDTEEDLAKALGMTEDELFSLAEDVGIDQYGGLTKDNYEDVMQHIIDNFEDYKQIGESPIIDDSLVKEEEVNEKDVTVDNEGNIAGYLDYIDECIDKISPDNVSEMAYRIQNAVDDIRTRELDLKASLIRDKFNEDDEEKGPEHYRYVNDSQLSRVQDRLRLTISELDHAIQYRAKNSHLFFNTGDKAGTGDLYGIKDKLEKIDDEWDDQTELYGM